MHILHFCCTSNPNNKFWSGMIWSMSWFCKQVMSRKILSIFPTPLNRHWRGKSAPIFRLVISATDMCRILNDYFLFCLECVFFLLLLLIVLFFQIIRLFIRPIHKFEIWKLFLLDMQFNLKVSLRFPVREWIEDGQGSLSLFFFL